METANTLAWTQVSEIELIYKSKVKASERPVILTSSDAHKLLKQNWDEDKIELVEQFKVLYLNRRSKVLGIFEVSTDGMTATIVDPKIVFTAALRIGASSLVLCHNHPSGNVKPSTADEQMTLKLKNAGLYLDLKAIDHLIITSKESYYSFAD